MPITLESETGSLVVFRVTGELGQQELGKAQNECERIIQKQEGIKMLILLENFEGWEKGEGWEDTSFADRNDEHIQKMAIVGEARWEDMMAAFTLQGLRPTPIKYFAPDQEATARQWLMEP